MNIQSEKLELIEWIAKLDDVKIIQNIKAVKKGTKSEEKFWQGSPDDLLNRAKESLMDIRAGRTIKLRDFKGEIRLWKKSKGMK